MSKILIVEDDKKLRQELETFLNKNGFEAKGLENFDNIIQDILEEKADLVLLDINLPYADGEFVCKEVRKVSNVPIIMITSRDNEIDELMSLNYGADQYVTKPYNIQILLAKINGLLKRNQNAGRNPEKIDCNGFVLNIAERVIEKDNQKMDLTKNEYSILYYLSIHKNEKVALELKDLEQEVYTDSKWTTFIINQFIQNAIKYSKKENKKIEIFAKLKNDKVILYIKDNGIGIKQGEMTRVFERGFTGENGRLIGQKSTGIGLYLCKKLCDKLSLGIELNSEKDKGTEVRIIFPKNSYTNFK